MVEERPIGECPLPLGNRNADKIICVQEVLRRSIEVELRQQPSIKAHLPTRACQRIDSAVQSERLADADGRDVDGLAGIVVPVVADVESRLLQVRYNRFEQVADGEKGGLRRRPFAGALTRTLVPEGLLPREDDQEKRLHEDREEPWETKLRHGEESA